MIKINKGLDLPILGTVAQNITASVPVRSVAVSGPDYVGCKPTMAVKVGDRVKLGQLIFSDKKTEGVHFTAPAAGTVKEINRGERRALLSVVIEVDETEEAVEFAKHTSADLDKLTGEQVAEQLQESGMWSALRTRPFSKVPAKGTSPKSIFVTAMDTNPLAADPAVVIAEHKEAFSQGLTLLTKLTGGKVFLCKSQAACRVRAEGAGARSNEPAHAPKCRREQPPKSRAPLDALDRGRSEGLWCFAPAPCMRSG